MPTGGEQILLLSSDLRRKYAEDILTALALPPGSVIQFRYEADYVVSSLQRSVADGSVVTATAILAFVGDADTATPFLLPVRFATVVSAVCVADIFVFRLKVGAYANLDQYPRTADSIRTHSRTVLDQLISANGRFCPAVLKFPDLRISEATDSAQHWLGAARRLALHPTFSSSYFVRIDPPVNQRGQQLSFMDDGRLRLTDKQSVRLLVSFYSDRYDPTQKRTLSCSTDGTFLRVSSDDSYEVAHRYDSVEFWLHPGTLNFDTLSRVTIALRCHGDDAFVPATMRFPVLVSRSASRLAARVATTTAGALLVALPAILGAGFPLDFRIVSAVGGAMLLAISTVVLTSGK